MNQVHPIHAFSHALTMVTALSSGFGEAMGEAGAWMLVFPAGTSKARDGRGPFIAGGIAEMKGVIERTRRRLGATELMVDYDHQGHFSAVEGVGGTARAAGWVEEMEARADGIWARIAWTDAASAAIKSREYRYLSPLFTTDAKNRVDELLNIALVNMPALDLTAIAARTQETDMKKIALLLGLAESADETAISEAITALKAASAGIAIVAAAAGVKDETDIKVIAAAIESGKVKTGAVSDAEVTALRAENAANATALAALQKDRATEKATAFVDDAIKRGVVNVKPMRDHYIKRHALSAEAALEVETEINAFVIVAGSGLTIVPPKPADGSVALSAEQKAVNRMLGLKDEAVLAELKAEAERTAAAA
jgi:phage I-like protein